ncbi:GNAT family N-acetyltransferase [bacterium]|jgi:ribosomal protein S18 acetylase RimI-like enzyme|nr:GNAT family N-acetyltransferase [bacterium]MBT3903925.1 GNAT family N-acetyltransferase [bacterium]MBT4577711.1 GNAT family N-acetyltransferase [bacterium]MBT5345605.1 GNAT family N-acetyltransferase [bacterium]MBT6130708.1 GNAT family N-acetyltransferase [bacterium]
MFRGAAKTWALLGLIAGMIISGVVVWRIHNPSERILDYQEKRDERIIADLFSNNIYWLFETLSFRSVESYLRSEDYKSRRPSYRMKVYLIGNNPVGFISYYKDRSGVGQIRFLVTDSNVRGRGIGKKLVQYAFDDLVRNGCSVVTLVTRTNNVGASRLYKRSGFFVMKQEDGFVSFAKRAVCVQ